MALSRVPGGDEIYVGGIYALQSGSALHDTGITHIVSVLKYNFKDIKGWDNYEHLNIDVDDIDDENLLGEFERSGEFIERGLKEGKDGRKGKVLIHCAMGKSRSVTVTIAFLLRKYSDYTVSSALSLIQQSRPIAEPNDGFMAQLELYKDMGCPTDIEAQPKYQRWIYSREIDLALAAGVAPDRVRFEDEEEQENGTVEDRQIELRCRKCRRNLATSPYIVTHMPPLSKESTPTNTGPISSLEPSPPKVDSKNSCASHFLHPLSWMRPALEQGLLSGRLECPTEKCKSLVGRYSWQGIRCSCGVWVCPAFTLQKGRVDEIMRNASASQTKHAGSATRIRLPPGMKGKENL